MACGAIEAPRETGTGTLVPPGAHQQQPSKPLTKRTMKESIFPMIVVTTTLAASIAFPAMADEWCSDVRADVSTLSGYNNIRGQHMKVSTTVSPTKKGQEYPEARVWIEIQYDWKSATSGGTANDSIKIYASWGNFSTGEWVKTIGPVTDVRVTNAFCVRP